MNVAPLLAAAMEPLVFEKSAPGRRATCLPACDVPYTDPSALLGAESIRAELPLPELSELDVVRHFTRLSQRNYSIDLGLYPLGSCTMKYNPKVHEVIARMPGFAALHPLQPEEATQGALELIYRIERMLAEIAGMSAACVQPAAGAHGELLSLMMVRAYHRARRQPERRLILVPDSAHGTNPASAARCGFQVRSVPTNADGLTDTDALRGLLDGTVAGLMLTNPNTLGLFESNVADVCRMVHGAGGLVYCDGANMNAIVGVARPGDMGFDVMHFNLHKTFSTPHGGGGPGCGAIAVGDALEPFLPVPRVRDRGDGSYVLDSGGSSEPRPTSDGPDVAPASRRQQSVGRVHSFHGAFLVAVRAYAYMRSLGPDGLRDVAETAVLNANYVRSQLREHYEVPHDRACMHEVVVSALRQKAKHGIRALDISKRLMDFGFHPPTNYFPLIVPEALMIEPTETESKETLDAFCQAMAAIAEECATQPEIVRGAPHTTVVSRLDETAAVKNLNLRWTGASPPRVTETRSHQVTRTDAWPANPERPRT